MGLNQLRRMEPLQSAWQVGRYTVTVASTISAKTFVSRMVETVKTAFAFPRLATVAVA